MKLIIAGSRSFGSHEDHQTQFDLIMAGREETATLVVSGGAQGADKMGEVWAARHQIPVKRFIPNWYLHGKAAGPVRNAEMADFADEAIAFWDGRSRGTKSMIDEMEKRGKKCIVVPAIH